MNNAIRAGAAFEQWRQATVPGFDYVDIDGIGVFKIASFENSGLVRHCFTSRIGGVSTGCFSSLNMSWTRTDSADNTRHNYEIAAASIGINPRDLVVVDGDHGITVLPVDASHKGLGIYRPWDIGYKFDGMTTDESGVALCTIHGDCTPIFILDPHNNAICMSHSGWRGTVDGMPGQSVATMVRRFGSDPSELLVAVGPAIGKCCFEVGQEVADIFSENYPMLDCIYAGDSKDKRRIDLLAVTLWQLYRGGIRASNVTVADMCTSCNEKNFHSYRRNGKDGGSMAGMLQLI